MIKPVKVHIKNFQSIADLEIDISGFTCITGKSNVGKSAIVRAISKAILNDPVVGLVRKGAHHSEVDIRSDDWALKWEKGEKGVNRYIIGDRVLDKTGQTQIEEIKKFGFSSVKLGGDEVQPWFAPQTEPIFLLNKTGQQVTEFISEVSGLNVLQDSIVISSRGRKRSLDEEKLKSEESEKIKKKLSSLNGLDDLVRLFEELELQRNSIQELEEKTRKLEELNSKSRNLSVQLNSLNPVTGIRLESLALDDLSKEIKILKILKKIQDTTASIFALRESKDREIEDIDDNIEKSIKMMRIAFSLSSVRNQIIHLNEAIQKDIYEIPKEEMSRLKSLSQISSSIRKTKKLMSYENDIKKQIPVIDTGYFHELISLSKLRNKSFSLKNDLERQNSELKLINDELKKLDEEIEKIPKCPTCGRVSVSSSSQNHTKHSQEEDQTSVVSFFLE